MPIAPPSVTPFAAGATVTVTVAVGDSVIVEGVDGLELDRPVLEAALRAALSSVWLSSRVAGKATVKLPAAQVCA